MAYFANGCEGMILDEQCEKCKYKECACLIYSIQINFNYEAVKNKVATEILNCLIREDGTCLVYEFFKKDLHDSNYATPYLNFEE